MNSEITKVLAIYNLEYARNPEAAYAELLLLTGTIGDVIDPNYQEDGSDIDLPAKRFAQFIRNPANSVFSGLILQVALRNVQDYRLLSTYVLNCLYDRVHSIEDANRTDGWEAIKSTFKDFFVNANRTIVNWPEFRIDHTNEYARTTRTRSETVSRFGALTSTADDGTHFPMGAVGGLMDVVTDEPLPPYEPPVAVIGGSPYYPMGSVDDFTSVGKRSELLPPYEYPASQAPAAASTNPFDSTSSDDEFHLVHVPWPLVPPESLSHEQGPAVAGVSGDVALRDTSVHMAEAMHLAGGAGVLRRPNSFVEALRQEEATRA